MSPALANTSSSSSSSKGAGKAGKGVDVGHAKAPVRRTVRRRGGRLNGIESDDEIEREVLSDASDSEVHSVLDSASDSDAESDAESVLDDHVHPDTPSTQSPPPGEIESASALDGFPAKKVSVSAHPPNSAPAFLSAGVDWSDMVTDEGINGAAALPVIDFADLSAHTHAESTPSTTHHREPTIATSVEEEDTDPQHEEQRAPRGTARDSRPPPRPAGQTARQAYQNRLQSDPSFIPRVGEFWGHDDRLLQEDLRSLSGWWRGKWRGRGRGRGGFIGRGMRGRGRGGFFGGLPQQYDDSEGPLQTEPPQTEEFERQAELEILPVDKQWTHDGFEEMKVREERRRAAAEHQRPAKPFNDGPETIVAVNSRGRGGFVPRGRGIYTPRRGAFSPSPSRPHSVTRFSHFARPKSDRTWFAMKPERIWTKQFEGFLYLDPELKPRPGKGLLYRVRVPGKGAEVIRTSFVATQVSPAAVQSQASTGTPSATETSRSYVVKLPKRASKQKVISSVVEAEPEPFTTVEELLAEPPLPAPALATVTSTSSPMSLLPVASSSVSEPAADMSHDSQTTLAEQDAMATPGLTRENTSSENSFGEVPSVVAQPHHGPLEEQKGAWERPDIHHLPPLQTNFAPPAQPSPSYGSPYGFPSSLPPGIALNAQGFAYEIASGRPVYMHPTPPPPIPLYNPRPMHHPGVFVPGHMHHASMSAEFMQAPHTPPINGFVDPLSGQPLFALPRQNSRVEIRAPSESHEGKAKPERRPSNLRSAAVIESGGSAPAVAQPPPPGLVQYSGAPEYFPEMSAIPQQTYPSSEGAASASPGNDERPLATQPLDPNIMGYAAYQQPYYYPAEQYYPAYIDISQQYDPYAGDPRHQPTVYY